MAINKEINQERSGTAVQTTSKSCWFNIIFSSFLLHVCCGLLVALLCIIVSRFQTDKTANICIFASQHEGEGEKGAKHIVGLKLPPAIHKSLLSHLIG